MSAFRVVVAAAPLGLAIAVFGVVFGAASSAEFGPAPTIVMSLLVFSGVVQFAVVALLTGGAGIGAILVTVIALNARNLVLGAALRPQLSTSRLRRAVLGWFLVDESFGLAVAAGRDAARVLALSGAICYLGWQVGTLLGVAGAQVVSLEDFASAIFPVLFVGLAVDHRAWERSGPAGHRRGRDRPRRRAARPRSPAVPADRGRAHRGGPGQAPVMSYELIALVALITYGSRMAALALLPPMPPRIAIVLERMPPALFAGLATTSVLTSDGSIGAPSVLVATLAAVIAAPLRSLMACLLAGIAGYAAAVVLGL